MAKILGSLALITLLASASAAIARDDTRVRAEVEEVLSDPRYQRTRPDGKPLPPVADKAPREREYRPPSFKPRDFEPSSASGISEALLWLLVGVAGAAVIAVAVRESMRWSSRRRQRTKKSTPQSPALDLSAMVLERLPATLARARALAADGDFEEAVHVLLEGALGYLHALANFNLEPAFTSREVLALAPLTAETRRAFTDLVMTVEVSLFGGLAVDAADFARCEASFVVLHRRLAERGPLGD